MVLEKYIVTVVISEDWGYCREEKYTLFSTSEREVEQHVYREYGKVNVKSIKKV